MARFFQPSGSYKKRRNRFPLPLSSANVTVSLTGVEATTSAGVLSVTGASTTALAGVAATGAVGTLSATIGDSVALTGHVATGSPGDLAITGAALTALSGVEGSANAGAVSATGAALADLTGHEATASVGDPTITGASLAAFTGHAATGAAGDVAVSGAAFTALDGHAATGSAGDLAASVNASTAITGHEATASVGTTTATGAANADLSGHEATAAIGTLTVDTTQATEVVLTGVSATGAAGDLTITGASTTALTGSDATATAGTLAASGGALAALSGHDATGHAGDVAATGGALTALTGHEATGAPGEISSTGGARADLSGHPATGAVGEFSSTGAAIVALTGSEASASAGTLAASVNDTAALTGHEATGSPGSVTVTGAALVALAGHAGTASTGTITVQTTSSTEVALSSHVATGSPGTLTITGAALFALEGSASTGAAGELAAIINDSAALTGHVGTGSAGSLEATGGATTALAGVGASTDAGTLAITGAALVAITGHAASGSVGTATAEGFAGAGDTVNLTGHAATGTVGSLTATGGAITALDGNEAPASVGEITATAGQGVTVELSGHECTGFVGSPAVIGAATVALAGHQATAYSGVLSVPANDLGGPFFLAWVNAETAFNSSTHAVEDEAIFAFEITHSEGEFAALMLDVINPRVGLLNTGRKQWAWLSWYDGSEVIPLFYGRLVGVPQDLQNEVVRFEFIAKPTDYETQKTALADTLKVAPYYDPVWLSEEARSDPDSVLEARPELWHIDRVTHVVTSSNIISGEDGTIALAGNYFYDSLRVTYTTTPGRSAVVTAQAVWRQVATGVVDISSKFPRPLITYTTEGLLNDWPENGASIGGGWTIEETTTGDKSGTTYVAATQTISTYLGQVSIWTAGQVVATMSCRYEADREFVETLSFTLDASVQPLLTDGGEAEIIRLDLSTEVDQAVDAGGARPIGDLKSRRYFQTTRGRQSVNYLVCLARAQLLARARAIDISLEIPFADGVDLSCRKNVSIEDDRLPGAAASGKIKSYRLSLNGDTGEAVASVSIGATIGTGSTAAADAGTPSYVATGYVNTGYQYFDGAAEAVLDNEVTVVPFDAMPINDDGLDFDAITADTAVESLTVFNEAPDQIAAIAVNLAATVLGFNAEDWQQVAEEANKVKTYITLDMKEIGQGPFETTLAITVSELAVPKTIDLEAAA